jgi:hypothetical protein
MTPLRNSIAGVWSSLVALSVLAAPGSARAEAPASTSESSKAECASGFEQSQLLRREGKLRASRTELLKCAQDACKRAVRDQCSLWLDEVERATPSVILQATLDGEDHTAVRVELNGNLLTESMVGMSYDLDPGPHKLRFTTGDFAPIEKSVVLREGEKLRTVQVAFQTPKLAPAETPPVVAAPTAAVPASALPLAAPLTLSPPPVAMARPVPALTYLFAGLAVVGGGAFAYFGWTGNQRLQELESECAPTCASSEVNPVERKLLLANVSAAAGAVGVVGALVTYWVRPSRPTETGALRPNVALGPHGVGTSLRLSF